MNEQYLNMNIKNPNHRFLSSHKEITLNFHQQRNHQDHIQFMKPNSGQAGLGEQENFLSFT